LKLKAEVVVKMERFARNFCGLILLVLAVLFVSCGGKEEFTQQATTQFFVQSYNPQTLDILWMIDNRSPMYRIHTQLQAQATAFFNRLAGMTSDYRMAFVSADMQFAKGALQPPSDPVILTPNLGTVSERATQVGNMVGLVINLQTGYADEGLESIRTALGSTFIPRDKVPLVVATFSDSDDHSPGVDSSGSAVNYYVNAYLQFKNNDPSLIRFYSINYEPLASGQQIDATTRCATEYDADIDSPGFQNRYFLVAGQLGGSTANICAADWADSIDLTGIELKTLPSSFVLSKTPNHKSIVVTVFQDSTEQQVYNISWTYNASQNSIDFASIPPQGSTIEVAYLPQ
jgi:hypothetical protein